MVTIINYDDHELEEKRLTAQKINAKITPNGEAYLREVKAGFKAYGQGRTVHAFPFHFKDLNNPEHVRTHRHQLKTELYTHVNKQKMYRWLNCDVVISQGGHTIKNLRFHHLNQKYMDRFVVNNFEELFY